MVVEKSLPKLPGGGPRRPRETKLRLRRSGELFGLEGGAGDERRIAPYARR